MYLALREMRFSKGRYILIGVIMLLVGFLVMFVTGLAQGLAYDNAASVQNMSATHFILEQGAEHRLTRSELSPQKLDEVRETAGAGQAEPLGVKMTTVVQDGEPGKVDVTLLAVDTHGWLMPRLTEGSGLPGTGQVVVDESLMEQGVKLGSRLVDQASGSEWIVAGFVQNESFSHTPVILMNMSTWALLESQSRSQAAGSPSVTDGSAFNAIAIKAVDSEAESIQAQVPGTEVLTKSQAVSAIPGYKEEQGSLLMMIVFLFVISAFVLAVFFYVMTIQKTSQYGVLKAMGARTAYLAGSAAAQVLILSAVSLVVSIVLVKGFEAMLPASMPFRLHLPVLLLTCLAFILMSLAGSLFSVWKIARINALEAIGRAAA
ncbi:ABC transporter permease [Paenibacillus sp. JX-17]|uniref:Putative hemin transport system permease protein HrtB n=1 Tax=Paenibacillus lacisoli TaxID=3064525 RepID=A0ABT9CG46_9BACL|nr:ABC transporter permease [Paenibacillus sp. JX-17]MDO7908227.1 ABC transporter permease [Paenibacillus sp. JX-17]